MRRFFLPAMIAGFALTFASIPAVSQTPQAAQTAVPDLKRAEDRDRETTVKPEIPPGLAAQFGSARKGLKSAQSVPCAASVKSAFSVTGSWHGSAGADAPLRYASVVTNIGGNYADFFGLIGVFTAPCTGQFFFTVSFVKDSYYNCNGNVGTQDDVMVYLTKSAGTTTTIDPPGAWSGEGAGRRGTGVYSVVLALNGGDQIASWVHSDGGPHRCLASYHFTGFRVAP